MFLLTLFLVLSATIVLILVWRGLPLLAGTQQAQRSPGDSPGPSRTRRRSGRVRPATLPCAIDVRLSGLLENDGEVLVGYTPHTVRSSSPVSTMGTSPSATATMVLRLGPDTSTVLPVLDRWCQDGVVLELRATDDTDVLVLWDRETSEQLDLTQLRAPR